MEVKVFVYDRLLQHYEMSRVLRKDIPCVPAFSPVHLYRWKKLYFAFPKVNKTTTKRRITFGSLYLLNDIQLDSLILYYGEEYFKLVRMPVTEISFSSIPSFLSQKWEVKEQVEAYVFIGNIENETVEKVYSDRRKRQGNFVREFLAEYQYGQI